MLSRSVRASDVLFLNHSAELGGGELALFDLVRNRTGSKVILFSNGPLGEKLRVAAVPVSILDAGGVLNARRKDGVFKVLRLFPSLLMLVFRLAHKFRGARLVYANSQKAFVASALASKIVRRPLIWHLHDILTPEHFSREMLRITIALANRCASHVIANSSGTAEAFRAAGGETPVTVVHNGIAARPLPLRPVRHFKTEATTREPVLGVFSRLAPWKGQHVVIRALTELPNCNLLVVGGALFNEDDYARSLRQLADELGVTNRVQFLGFIDDIWPIMDTVDLIIHSSTSPEPFGRVIVEGMLAGKPVIATAAGGALEIIENGVSGVLVPPDDAPALAASIKMLLANPAYAEALATTGRNLALSRFELATANSRIETIIMSLEHI